MIRYGLLGKLPLFLQHNPNYLLRILSLLAFVMVTVLSTRAQTGDSVSSSFTDTLPTRVDSDVGRPVSQNGAVPPAGDSVFRRPVIPATWQVSPDTPLFYQVLRRHPYFNFAAKPIVLHSELRKVERKEALFYVLMALLLLFALLKQAFGKYFTDLFRVFFRTTIKQRQIREQLMQDPLPSLLFNLFFVASAGLYVGFLFRHFGLVLHRRMQGPIEDFWLIYLYSCAALAVIYTGKFIALKIAGWLFNIKQATDSYIFIVFIISKMIGIFLLPFLVLLAFASEPIYSVALVLSWCGIGGLLFYRFVLGYAAVRNEVRFNLFHFFLYLCAFELAPLLLIGKLLFLFFHQN